MMKNIAILGFSAEGQASSQHSLLEPLRALSTALPTDVVQSLGTMTWSERIHAVESSGDKTTVRFFSDGLNLQAKMAVEAFLRTGAQGLVGGELSVYMERKNKPEPSASTTAKRGTDTPSQSAERPHAHGQSVGANAHAPSGAPSAKPSAGPVSGKRGIDGVKRIIAVASGKGGVGKSTVSVNLAVALHNQGYKVGLLDADIYGPSLPMMLGLREDPSVNEKNKIVPPERHGLKVMSFGFFAPDESAVIWRGPMVMKALQQFFYDVDWGELDFLVIDLPPGTGDAQLTLVQSLPLSGAVIVTTPQNVALLDAVKGVMMFRKTDVPVVGVVENMSTFHCPACGSESHIFGEGGAEAMSGKFEVPVLGHVPLVGEIRAAGDNGQPLTTLNGHPLRVRFSEIAERVVARVIDLEKEAARARMIPPSAERPSPLAGAPH